MDQKVFIQRDIELQSAIQEYQDDTNSKNIAIAMNKKEIDRLEFERVKLHALYRTTSNGDQQRNLQGEIIK